MSRVPVIPPTKCTPTTSSESSKPNLYFMLIAVAQTEPAMSPTGQRTERIHETAGRGDGDQTGNRAGRGTQGGRACRPESARPATSSSTAVQVAIVVLVKATPARSLALSAEPELKPYQPNHSRLAPSST